MHLLLPALPQTNPIRHLFGSPYPAARELSGTPALLNARCPSGRSISLQDFIVFAPNAIPARQSVIITTIRRELPALAGGTAAQGDEHPGVKLLGSEVADAA